MALEVGGEGGPVAQGREVDAGGSVGEHVHVGHEGAFDARADGRVGASLRPGAEG